MSKPPTNWQTGVKRSRAVRSAKAIERDARAATTLMVIAQDHGPKTLADYARIMNEECYTPSGRGKWSISLVHRYMRKSGWTPKTLRAVFFKERLDHVYDYSAHLYAEWRVAIGQVHALSAENGRWTAASAQDLKLKQTVRHMSFGIGSCVERLSLATYRCRFPTFEDAPEFRFVVCRAIDLEGFEYFLPVEARQQKVIEAQVRIFSKAEKVPRKLIDGWHL